MDALPGFEFPRKDLYDYTIEIAEVGEDETTTDDFIIGPAWGEILDESLSAPKVLIDRSRFNSDLSSEEINILAILMK